MNEMSWISRTREEPIAPVEAREPAPLPALVPDSFADRARRRWWDGLAAGEGALVALGPVVREGLREVAEGTAGLSRSARDGTAGAVASARLALPEVPGRLRDGLVQALDAAGFGPLRLLLSRHPGLAMALGMPVLIASLFLAFWSGVSAALLGLWCVTMSLVLANQAARGMYGDDAGSTKLLTKETPS